MLRRTTVSCGQGASDRLRRLGRGGLVALVALLVAAGLTCATMSARDVTRTFPTRRYVLPSGLRVVIEEDPSASLVGVVWVIDVGAVDDPAFRGEMAHAVEHLAFQLPVTAGQSPWQQLLDLGGIGVNGATGFETTTFKSFAPRAELDRLLAVELGRMGDPLGTGDDATLATELARERPVLREERNLRDDTLRTEEATFFSSVFRFPHPFARATFDPEPGASIPPGALRAFVRAHYRPEKMTLVVSGAIPLEWDAQLLSRMPRALAGDRAAPRAPVRRPASPLAATPPAGGKPDLDRVRSPIVKPYLRIGWWLPGARGLAGVPSTILGEVVGLSLDWAAQSGELPNVLDAWAETQVNEGGSLLECVLILRDDGRAEAVRARVVDIVTERVFKGYRLYDVAARTVFQKATLEAVLELQSLQVRTMASAQLAHADWNADIGAMIRAVNAVSEGQLSDLGKRYLTAGASRSSLFRQPMGAPSKPERVSTLSGNDTVDAVAESGPPEPLAEPPRPESRVAHSTEDIRRAAAVPALGAARVLRLRNELTVIALRRAGPAFVSMVLGFRSAPSPDAPPGIWQAAKFGRDYTNMWGPLEDGILERALTGRDQVGQQLSTFAAQAVTALDYLADKTNQLEVHWPDEMFVRWSSIAAADERSLEEYARLRFLRTLWPARTYGSPVPAVDVMERTDAEVKTWIGRVERPENGALVIVGDIDPDEAVRAANRDLRWAWANPPANAAPLTAPPPVRPQPRSGPMPIQFNEAPARRAASIAFGCFLPPALTPRDGVVGELLGKLLNQYLFERLRLRERRSYSERVVHSQLWGGTSALEGNFDIEDASVVEGTSLIESCLTEGGQTILDPVAIERVRWKVALARAAQFASNDDVARSLFEAWKLGWSPAMLDEVPGHLATVSTSDLEAALRTCRASAVVSVTAAVAMH
jgi:zinc protease